MKCEENTNRVPEYTVEKSLHKIGLKMCADWKM